MQLVFYNVADLSIKMCRILIQMVSMKGAGFSGYRIEKQMIVN